MERDDRGQAFDLELGEGAAGAGQGLVAGRAGDDELGEHGVELAADHASRLRRRSRPDAGAGGLRYER